MKVVGIDNFDRDEVPDFLVCENVSEHYGKLIVDMLNADGSHTSPKFFVLRQDDYKLKEWEP